MRKFILFLMVVTGSLQAQTTGQGAVAASESNWENWTFAGTAIVTAAAGIFVLAIDNGRNAH